MTFETACTLQDLLDVILAPGLVAVIVEMRSGKWGVVTMTKEERNAYFVGLV
jgi:hypothetical protein